MLLSYTNESFFPHCVFAYQNKSLIYFDHCLYKYKIHAIIDPGYLRMRSNANDL